MTKESGNTWLFFAKAALVAVVLAVFYAGQILFYAETRFYFWGNGIILLLYAVNLLFTCRIYRSMHFGSVDRYESIISWILCLVITNGLKYLILSLLNDGLLHFMGFLIVSAAQIVLVIPMVFLIDKLYYYLHPAQKAIIIYGNADKAQYYSKIINAHRKKFKIRRTLSQTEPVSLLLGYIEDAETVFFMDVEEKTKDQLLEYCYRNEKCVYILPSFSGILLNTADISWISNTPMFLPKTPEIESVSLFAKRCMDITVSLLAIILLSWLMLIAWVLVRTGDRGPAIYKQSRVTKGGKTFTLYKFRSMRTDAEADGIARLSSHGDDRITSVGKFIRKTRIDELPQLFNVLFGSMSLVGPRPERPEIAKQYEESFPNFSLRTKVKAGLTGYAQIYGKYNTAPDEKLFLDIMYIGTFSIWQDVKLMLQTLKVVFMPSSSEGIAKDATTALLDNSNSEKETKLREE